MIQYNSQTIKRSQTLCNNNNREHYKRESFLQREKIYDSSNNMQSNNEIGRHYMDYFRNNQEGNLVYILTTMINHYNQKMILSRIR